MDGIDFFSCFTNSVSLTPINRTISWWRPSLVAAQLEWDACFLQRARVSPFASDGFCCMEQKPMPWSTPTQMDGFTLPRFSNRQGWGVPLDEKESETRRANQWEKILWELFGVSIGNPTHSFLFKHIKQETVD